MGKVQKGGASVPSALSDDNENQRVTISSGLHARHLSTDGQKKTIYRIVTGDKKWCLYINMKQCKEWLSPGKQATQHVRNHHQYEAVQGMA